MASLKKCKTCKKQVSSEAPSCPHCGQANPVACFPYSARVLTPTGPKPIGEMKRGDSVLSFDSNSGQVSLCTVTRRIDHQASSLLAVHTVGSASPLLVTSNHPLLTLRGWVQAKRLRNTDQLCVVNEKCPKPLRVTAVTQSDHTETLHNLHTTQAHNFIVEGFVAHNFVYFRKIRSVWHRWFVDPPVEQAARLKGTPESASLAGA
jgi:hypothetical protein